MCQWAGYGLIGLAVLNRVYNFTCLCPKLGENLSYTEYGTTSQEMLTLMLDGFLFSSKCRDAIAGF